MTRETHRPDGEVPSALPSNIGSPEGHPLAGVQGAEPPGLALGSRPHCQQWLAEPQDVAVGVDDFEAQYPHVLAILVAP
jgi:hypothetical protein